MAVMTRVSRLTMAVAGACGLVLSAGPVWSQTEDVRAAVEAANKEWIGAFTRGDGVAVAGLYTAGAQVLPPQSGVVQGKDAIARFWQGAFDSGVKGVTLATLEAEASGETAYEVGTYELVGADGKVVDAGKYVVVWKKEDGKWRLHRDIWNTSVPPSKP